MDILLFSAHGGAVATPEMERILNRTNFPENRRGEIIDYVRTNHVTVDNQDLRNIMEIAKKNRDQIYQIYESSTQEIYHIWNSEYNYLSSVSIEKVDETRPWTIAEYDGAEYVQYLDYDIISKEMNYCELKNCY